MKKTLVCFLLLFVLCVGMVFPVSAAEPMEYKFELTIDGSETKEVQTGDVITVVLRLHRTDKAEAYTMYAMQDEIRYDGDFFELVEGSEMLANKINTTDIALRDNHRAFYMNYLTFSNGEKWDKSEMIGSFQLRVKGTSGVTKISNMNYLVSLPDGSGGYASVANEVTVILSTKCTFRFESNGGSVLDNMEVQYGEKLKRPKDPVREGMYFVGWFKDIDLEEPWDFETDTVSGNTTLYAKWSETPVDNNLGDGNEPGSSESQAMWWWLLLLLVLLIVIWWLYNRAKEKAQEEQK